MLLEILVEIEFIWTFHVTFLSMNYLLNILSFCIGIIPWCCFIVPLFRCTSHVPLFRGIPIVPPVFQYSASAPVFLWCSVFRSSVFRCSWFYSIPEISAFVRVTSDFFFRLQMVVASAEFFVGSLTVSVQKYSFTCEKTNPKMSLEIRYNRLNHQSNTFSNYFLIIKVKVSSGKYSNKTRAAQEKRKFF